MNRLILSIVICTSISFSLSPAAQAADSAENILAATGVKGGLVVHLGCGDGRLIAELKADDRYFVHGLDADPGNVDRARDYLQAEGVCGYVAVEQFTGDRLPYAENLVRLLVADHLGDVTMEEVMRVLAPGGVALIGGEKTVKPWPAEYDEWTHWRHGADGNMVSKDRLVGPPRHVRWTDGPLWQNHHGTEPSMTVMVSAGGRLLSIANDAPMGVTGMPGRWRLIARDAFSGLVLWKRPIDGWGWQAWGYWEQGHTARFNHPIHIRKRLVAVGDRVYVTLGFNAPVTALDAVTGTTIRTYPGTEHTDELVCLDGILYLSVNDRPQRAWLGKGVAPVPPEKQEHAQKRIWAVEAETGSVIWKSGPFVGNTAKPDRMGSLRHLALTVSDKGVFVVDQRHIVCLEPETGRQRWRTERLITPPEPADRNSMTELFHGLNEANMHTVVFYQGVLLVVHPHDQPSWSWVSPAIIQALSPETGEELWRYETTPVGCLDLPDLMGARGLVWAMNRKDQTLIGLNAATGRKEREISIAEALKVGHHHRCYPNRATEDYVIIGRRGAEFVNLVSGQVQQHHWARGSCRFGHLPANGLLYRPPDPCKCYMSGKLQGFYALASKSASGGFSQCLSEDNPLEKGPAYGAIEQNEPASRATDWPTYRHDPMRSGSVPTAVPAELNQAWTVDLGGKLSSPVMADGRVYVSSVDRHQLHALNSASGKLQWSYTAGGRIDSPPTILAGMAIFGSADGWLYCLRAADGELAWRFRAAPGERRVMSHGQIESAWPVSGSVLVVGGVVFCTAGRSSFLDDGIFVYAIEAETGRLLERKQIHDVQPYVSNANRLPPEAPGASADILLTDGRAVYLRHRKLELSTLMRLDATTATGLSGRRLIVDGGFLDDFWFHRAYWRLGGVQGNLIVFDQRAAYATAMHQSPGSDNYRFYVPAGGRTDSVARGRGKGDPGWLSGAKVQHGGYHLLAVTHKGPQAAAASGRKRDGGAQSTIWHNDRFPICPRAMVAAGKTLLVAGFPDRIDPKDPWATFEGRRGGVLCELSAADGEKLAEYKLAAPPVFNGMAAADGKVYLSLTDGSILCLSGK